MKSSVLSFFLPALVPAAVVGAWIYWAPVIDNELLLPSPSSVAAILVHPAEPLLAMGSVAVNMLMSFARVAVGFTVGTILGIVAGLVMGRFKLADRILGPFLELFRPIPSLAWVPLLLAWFGMASVAGLLGIDSGPVYPYLDNLKLSMLFILILGGFFPTFTGTYQGVRSVPRTLVESSRVLGASESDIFFKVLLPGSAPGIFNGIRIGITLDWCHLVAAEMLPGASSGMGYLIFDAQMLGRMDIVIAGMILIGATGALLDYGCRVFERKKLGWSREVR
ncbi:MAG: ABC transporter permease [Desulfovibrio sp.]|nr:ABC transporter permease [Desulfovibrio sp.]